MKEGKINWEFSIKYFKDINLIVIQKENFVLDIEVLLIQNKTERIICIKKALASERKNLLLQKMLKELKHL